MVSILRSSILLFASFFLLSFSNLSTINCLSFSSNFVVPENIPGNFKKFLTDFYTAVDASDAQKSVSYFCDKPVPVVASSGKTVIGKAAIINIFKNKVADATFEKVITSVNRVESSEGLQIVVNGRVTKTLKIGGQKTQYNYYAKLHFLDQQYYGVLYKMESKLSS
ncbi:uncharacterized protein MELLADRAFT_39287 [Melampsora larici-populina 98AG31]|uniref:Secreted protein n=1 Tax=Melampsora larici-populina (strain 98AG31 / pathotype 3-4-7) TaxID=747676 RepID=F4S2E3_MELLP|nr:uncharacterized protein MELLADRAFT_39287 [Melampsora larici-populina 98AG31]EGG01220.1 secreted protein [Melampsora larici-populina 98AG31]